MKQQLFLLLMFTGFGLQAQKIKPDVQDSNRWQVIGKPGEPFNENGKHAIKFSEEGMAILKDYGFSNGIIEFDVKGKNVLQQSFVGFAFHIQDEKTFDVVYFRPFNFMNPDTIRRPRSVQYMSLPDYPWPKLREGSPGKYENKVTPVPNPDDWFHAKITVEGKYIKVYVNNSVKPSLEVEKLTQTTNGKVGLWFGVIGGSFANVEITTSKP